MAYIEKLIDKNTLSFISKKAQLYTIFSVFFKMIDDNEEISDDFVDGFKTFVSVYNKFRNDYIISFEKTDEQSAFESIKKYKLASSEGVNKIMNRMLRYEIMYDFCVNGKDKKICMDSLEKQFDTLKCETDNALDESDLNDEL